MNKREIVNGVQKSTIAVQNLPSGHKIEIESPTKNTTVEPQVYVNAKINLSYPQTS